MNREESIKLARDIKAKGGVGPKKIGLSYSKDDPLNKIKRKINSILKEGYSFKCCCPVCKDLQRDKKLYSFRCSCGGIQYPTIENCSNRPGIMNDILFIKCRIMGL